MTGKNGYIVKSFSQYIKNLNINWEINSISLRDLSWEDLDFSEYDVIIHCAALVHNKKKTLKYRDFQKLNVDLTNNIALKAFKEGNARFVFLSSMAVYGNSKVINSTTSLKPNTYYGLSKYQAEDTLFNIFKTNLKRLVILRPPIIYGPNAKGNSQFIEKFANYFCIFPENKNKKSFLLIDNLNSYILNVIKEHSFGIFHPRNDKLMSTFELFSYYRSLKQKKSKPSSFLGYIFNFFLFIPIINKIFGNQYYEGIL